MTRFSAARDGHRWGRPVVACLLVGMLAACGQTTTQRAVTQAPVSNSQWARPSSYDAPGPSHDPWGPYITQASQRFDIPERWIREVMRQESGGRVSATSRVGAMGLMQVMPGTYRELRAKYDLGSDPYHPWDSLMAGTAYLREMYELYGAPAFLAAYNAGPRRLEDYLWGSRGLPAETRNYVARIGPRIQGAHPNRRAAPEVYAAAEIPLSIPAGPRRGDTATMLALRDQRRAVDPGIRVATLPPGPVVRMDPIPDGSTSQPQPTQLASAGGFMVSNAAAAGVSYAPQGTVVAMAPVASLGDFQTRMEPIASPGDGVAASAVPASSLGTSFESYQTATAPVTRMAPVVSPGDPGSIGSESLAMIAPPPAAPAVRAAAAPRPAQTVAALSPAAPTSLPFVRVDPPGLAASPAPRGFSLIPQAHASTLPAAPRPSAGAPATGGGWSIQVGAFASENLARAAAGQARERVGTTGTRLLVQPAPQGRTTLYRARVLGLADRDAAEAACERMRGRSACMVVAPGA
ncbi:MULTISPECIES: transglycosylase SLT domain-containing protein [Roseomonadaceae]|uniref:Transglycosylase SLT domain-containing protein n=1 Tax=Falsiroseomonas oleicola TaxID=2801474 RepID=A0ABS6H2B7_9PROT|nr:transglycosylase SLT domain-containing protein [Roseomonas oleicola]MBU8542807.1 transglycosylase SLT domain-containing protein [Roseomonas oleicola]